MTPVISPTSTPDSNADDHKTEEQKDPLSNGDLIPSETIPGDLYTDIDDPHLAASMTHNISVANDYLLMMGQCGLINPFVVEPSQVHLQGCHSSSTNAVELCFDGSPATCIALGLVDNRARTNLSTELMDTLPTDILPIMINHFPCDPFCSGTTALVDTPTDYLDLTLAPYQWEHLCSWIRTIFPSHTIYAPVGANVIRLHSKHGQAIPLYITDKNDTHLTNVLNRGPIATEQGLTIIKHNPAMTGVGFSVVGNGVTDNDVKIEFHLKWVMIC